MKIEVKINIIGSKENVWRVISDIENSADNISGIEKIEILNKPVDTLIGLKWVETRTLFGKTATETMWITESEENKFYKTRAESHGAVYITQMKISEAEDLVNLSMEFNSMPQTFGARIMGFLFGWLFKNATIKALNQDLMDIKSVVENKYK